MEEILMKQIVISVAVCLVATFVSFVLWTVAIGYGIMGNFQNKITGYYANAGLNTMIDSSNYESIDSCNLYKMVSINRNVITGLVLFDKSGHVFEDLEDLLDIPNVRWQVDIKGDADIGFQVKAQQL